MRIGPHTETFNDHVLFTAHWGHYRGPNEADKSSKLFQEQILLPLKMVCQVVFTIQEGIFTDAVNSDLFLTKIDFLYVSS